MLVEIVLMKDVSDFKAVQLNVNKSPVLVLGSENSYHRDILEDFLEARNIAYELINSPEDRRFYIPALKGEDYEVVGMGTFTLWSDKKLYGKLQGKSSEYNVGIDKKHKALVMKQLKSEGWKPI